MLGSRAAVSVLCLRGAWMDRGRQAPGPENTSTLGDPASCCAGLVLPPGRDSADSNRRLSSCRTTSRTLPVPSAANAAPMCGRSFHGCRKRTAPVWRDRGRGAWRRVPGWAGTRACKPKNQASDSCPEVQSVMPHPPISPSVKCPHPASATCWSTAAITVAATRSKPTPTAVPITSGCQTSSPATEVRRTLTNPLRVQAAVH